MSLKGCYNYSDFRKLAKNRLPAPIFHYIDGAADDEKSHLRNTAAFDDWDLIPNVLRGVDEVDLSTDFMGQRLALPFYCSPTALQRLFHYQGERAVAAAAGRFGTLFGVSSLGTVSLEETRKISASPQVYQFYFHKDRGLNKEMIDRAKRAGVEVMMLTVDSITGGNRERDKRSGFAIPFKLTLRGVMQFAIRPTWVLNHFLHGPFALPQLSSHIDMKGDPISISRYFTEMLEPSLSWDDVAEMVEYWNGPFCLKGVIAVDDAKRAAEVGCSGIVLSNHGGRQLDGSRCPLDQLEEVVDAAGHRVEVAIDGGIRRGTHVLKALSLGAKAVGLGRYYLFPLAAGGQQGVEYALALMQQEITRDLKLMGCRSVRDLTRGSVKWRYALRDDSVHNRTAESGS